MCVCVCVAGGGGKERTTAGAVVEVRGGHEQGVQGGSVPSGAFVRHVRQRSSGASARLYIQGNAPCATTRSAEAPRPDGGGLHPSSSHSSSRSDRSRLLPMRALMHRQAQPAGDHSGPSAPCVGCLLPRIIVLHRAAPTWSSAPGGRPPRGRRQHTMCSPGRTRHLRSSISGPCTSACATITTPPWGSTLRGNGPVPAAPAQPCCPRHAAVHKAAPGWRRFLSPSPQGVHD